MRDDDGKVARFITQIEDITAAKDNERVLAGKAAQLDLTLEAVRGEFWYLDIAEQRFETSDRLARFIGGPEAAKLDLDTYLLQVNEQDGPAADLTPLIMGQLDQSVAEYRLNTVGGERWMRCDRRLLRDVDGTRSRSLAWRSISPTSITGLKTSRGTPTPTLSRDCLIVAASWNNTGQ